jgi:hypothetical protein
MVSLFGIRFVTPGGRGKEGFAEPLPKAAMQ